jgi:inosine/xanthosine triphosphatase
MASEGKKFGVGSLNAAKVDAVKEVAADYPHLSDATVAGRDVQSGVSNQPKTLDETIRGAKNRAEAAYEDNDYGVGLESGLMEVPHAKSGYMDLCAACIYDGTQHHIGLSSAWEFPDTKVMDLITKDGIEMSEAVHKAGLTEDPKIGSNLGAIGLLTRGKVDRKEFTKQALRNAFMHIDPENKK